MKKFLSLLITALCMTATLSAQEKKAFTLNDVIPGGSNYFNLTPENMPGSSGLITAREKKASS